MGVGWKVFLFIVLQMLLVERISTAQVRVAGYIVNEHSNNPIKNANVQVSSSNVVSTDSLGHFLFFLKDTRSFTILVSHIEYESKTISCTIRRDTIFRIGLVPISHTLSEVSVVGVSSARQSSNQAITSVDYNKSIPVLGERNIDMLLQQKAGVAHAQEINPGLYVRGFSNSQNKIFLNGAPIFNANHLLGVFPSFNAKVISRTELLTDDIHPRYGNYLSSCLTMDSYQNQASQYDTEIGVGMLTSQVYSRGPIKKEKVTYTFGVRYSYFDIISRSYNKLHESGNKSSMLPLYSFYDINGSVLYEPDEQNRVIVNYFHSKDGIKQSGNYLDIDAIWGNSAGSISWVRTLSPSLRMLTDANFSNYKTNSDVSKTGQSKIDNSAKRYMASLELQYTFLNGAEIDLGAFVQSIKTNVSSTAEEVYGNNAFLEKMAGKNGSCGWYAQVQYQPYSWLSAKAGVRAEIFDDEKTYVLPNLFIRAAITSDLSFFTSYSHRLQSDHLYSPMGVNLPIDIIFASKDSLYPQKAKYVGAGFSYRLNRQLQLLVSGYYSKLENQVDFLNPDPLSQGLYFAYGKGYAKGVEFSGAYRTSLLSVDLSYSLSETRRKFDNINEGRWFSPPYDIRHKLDFSVFVKITPKIGLSASQFVQSGNVVTIPVSLYYNQDKSQIVPVYGDRYNFRLPMMHRLDMALQYRVAKKSYEYTWSLGIYNVYNQANPYFIYFAPVDLDDGSTVLSTKKKSLLPMVPFFMLEIKL